MADGSLPNQSCLVLLQTGNPSSASLRGGCGLICWAQRQTETQGLRGCSLCHPSSEQPHETLQEGLGPFYLLSLTSATLSLPPSHLSLQSSQKPLCFLISQSLVQPLGCVLALLLPEALFTSFSLGQSQLAPSPAI